MYLMSVLFCLFVIFSCLIFLIDFFSHSIFCPNLNRNTTRSDFVFHADRLIRLVVEEGLNQLPSTKCEIKTPLNQVYNGLKYSKGNCGG